MFSLKDQLAFRQGALNTISQLQSNIRDKAPTSYGPMNNTGEAALSLKYRWVGEDKVQIYSDMPNRSFNYLMTLETGRGPGKPPPTEPILKWIQQRGINPDDISQKSLAYLIARKIGNEGSLVFRQGGNTGIISEVQTDAWIFENFIKPLESDLKRYFNAILANI
jgi:hypothetical protein